MDSVNKLRLIILALALMLAANRGSAQSTPDPQAKTLVVLFDGLRPDYITPEAMPNLHAFSKSGSYGLKHHSVFPTVTRVNSSSYSSGSYPQTHGLMGNTVYFPDINSAGGLNTGNYSDLAKISEATHGHLLTTITLGEVLSKHNQRMMVFSSGSQGQALMQNHTISGGAIVNPQLIIPESFKEDVIREVGPLPTGAADASVHKWITDAWIKFGLATDGPLVSSIWYADPDGVAHDAGIGAPGSMESIKVVDTEFGRILSEIKSRNLSDKINIIVSADHGFISHSGTIELGDFLISHGLKKKDSEEIVLAGNAIFVANHDPVMIRKIVSALQAEPWIGPIFTKGKPGEQKGSVDGTLSFESIHWDHPTRAADILVDYNWSDEKNEYGYAGKNTSAGVAGHGGLSPYEVHIALLASGPAFKKNYTSELPTSNVDIAPTILSIHKLPVPKEMDGRVMSELLQGGKTNEKARVIATTVTTAIPGGQYKATLQRTVIGRFSYVDKATTIRKFK